MAQFYVGRKEAEWFGAYEASIGGPEFPPPDATGVWYAIYVGDSPILQTDQRAFEYVLERGRLVGFFPLHYGAKDRSIAVFYQQLGTAGEAPVAVRD